MKQEIRICQNCKNERTLYKRICFACVNCNDCIACVNLRNKSFCTGNKQYSNQRKCEVEFETSYSPDRPEIVYCEKYYQQEVY